MQGGSLLNFPEIVTVVKDIMMSLAAVTGTAVGIYGLSTWKRQHRGQSEYELSRRILITLYKYRDAVYRARHPAIWGYEMPSSAQDTTDAVRFNSESKVYQDRWEKVQLERISLYPDLVEGKALWGDGFRTGFDKLFELERELHSSIRNHLELLNPNTAEDLREDIKDLVYKRRAILHDTLSEEDAFRKSFQSGVDEIEAYLKYKLLFIP